MAPRRSSDLAVVALAALSAAAAFSLGRVFDDGRFALPVAGAALLPHALAWFARRRRWPAASEVVLSAVALAAYAVWALEGSTTRFGVPTADTFAALGRHLGDGYDSLRTAVVPAPVTDGALLLAVVATWVTAEAADVLAFRRDATVAAVAPGLCLFVWASTLGTADLRSRATIAFTAAALLFLLLQHQALLERRRSWFAGRHLGAGTGLVAVAAVAAVAAVVGGAVIGPALPGAQSEALVDVKGLGEDGAGGGDRSYRTEPPLALIGENFVTPEPAEAFTVRAVAPEYWRIAALDQYSSDDGGQWTLTAEGSGEVVEGLDGPGQEDDLAQEYRIGALEGRWMPAAYQAVEVEGGDALVVRDSTTLVTGRGSVQGLRYRVRSRVAPPRAEMGAEGRAATERPLPPDLEEFTRLPPDFPEDVRDKAAEIVEGAADPYERALSLEAFFLDPDEFTYSLAEDVELGPNAQSQSAIREFVLVRRTGFCVQFAGSFAAMARAVGIPARVAVGYTPGSLDRESGVYRVSTWDAHAWPEVWLAGLGWTRFEPTPPGDGPGGTPGGSDLPERRGGSAEPPGGPTATTTAPTATSTPASAVPPTSAAPRSGTVDVTIDAPGTSGEAERDRRLLSLSRTTLAVALGCLVLAAVGAAIAVLVAKRRLRRHRRRSEDPVLLVTGAWEEALDRLGEAGIDAHRALTPLELSDGARARVPADAATPLDSLARTYTATRYGPRAPDDATAHRAWARVDAITVALRTGASRRERWRRRLDPAPLRKGRR